MTHLKRRWLEVLAAEDAALDSAGRARLIASEEGRTHSRRLATDRKWLETVDWGGLRLLPDLAREPLGQRNPCGQPREVSAVADCGRGVGHRLHGHPGEAAADAHPLGARAGDLGK